MEDKNIQIKFDASLYNDAFFEWHLKYAREYSIKTMDWFIEKYKPKSLADFGCGIGSYLESAKNHKLLNIYGVDISESAKQYTPEFIQDYIEYADCTKYIQLHGYKFDCVLSFETAEHIDPDGTDQFISNLINATGKWLLFTAAPPGQEGCGHINCQPKEFWFKKFSNYLTYDIVMTETVSEAWRKLGAPNYICDNLIVFKR
jgi:cyclopropane fatty-acyl-phospholipid synthase-like methyltransferase